MADTKTKVTLVGTVLAKQGVEFIYEGEVAACDSCKVKKACNNLQKGRKYPHRHGADNTPRMCRAPQRGDCSRGY